MYDDETGIVTATGIIFCELEKKTAQPAKKMVKQPKHQTDHQQWARARRRGS